jgi:hypothetical protein
MSRFISLLFLLLASFRLALGQEQEEAPAPIITSPTDHMKWTMRVDTDQGSPGTQTGTAFQARINPHAIKATKWEYQKGGKLTQTIVTYVQGGTREYWRVGPMVLCENARNHTIDLRGDGYFLLYPKECDGFYGIGMVKTEDDQGAKSFKGISYHYFRGLTVSGDPNVNPNATHLTNEKSLHPEKRVENPTISYEAWFDLKTGLPKAFSQNGETLVFEFSPDIPGDLQLPPKFQAAWNQAAGIK